MLSILDTSSVSNMPKLVQWWLLVPHLARRLCLHVRRCCRIPHRDLVKYLKGRWAALRKTLFVTTRQPLSDSDICTEPTPVSKTDRGEDRYSFLVSQYRPQKYAGVVDLFAIDAGLHKIPPEKLFNHYSRGGVRIHRVSGDHDSMIDEDHSQDFATILEQAIEAA